MSTFNLIGKLAENPRGKRLQKSVAAAPTGELPEFAGLCLGTGQDYQTRTPVEQRKWLAWATRPGCALILVPPFQTSVSQEPNAWEMASLEKPPILDQTAHPVLRLTQTELNVWITRGLTRTMNPLLDGGTAVQLNGLFRKHPDSGIFAVTSVPVWSLALADHAPSLKEWLSSWLSMAGRPTDVTQPVSPAAFEPTQPHYSVMLYLSSGKFSSRTSALEALAWNDTFEFSGEDVPSLLDDLEAARLTAGGALTEEGRRTLLESPYRRYAETYLNPPELL